jgi:hypothetical protein
MNTQSKPVLVATARAKTTVSHVTVWKLQTDIDNWPSWQSDIATVKLLGPLVPGTQFRWKAMEL